MKETTYNLDLLSASLKKWQQSGSVRAFYNHAFDEMMTCCPEESSLVLELGSGIGKIKEKHPHVVTSDINKTPYVDEEVSAYDIERTDRRWDAIMAVDMLHHLCKPFDFFSSASNSLRPGGRIVLLEPAATPGGLFFYRLFHVEPILPDKINPPYVFEPDKVTREFANMGMASALFNNQKDTVSELLKSLGLMIRLVRFRDIMAYHLTGGFSKPALGSPGVVSSLLELEDMMPQWLMRFLGLRVLIVMEKV